MRFLSQLTVKDLEFAGFMMAVLLYALCGTPTPNDPGLVELSIAALMIAAFARSFLSVFSKPGIAHILLYYGMSIPFVVAVFQGAMPGAMVRDLAAFLFFLLPLIGVGIFKDDPQRAMIFKWGFVFLGLAFAVRAVLDFIDIMPGELHYFANSPAVLFACVFLMGAAAYGAYNAFQSSVFLLLASLPVLAMSLTLQRASLAYFAIIAVGFLFVIVRRKPVYGVALLAVLCMLGIVLRGEAGMLIDALSQKTILFGGNMRVQEIEAVWQNVSGSIWYVLFGQGWGASFESPAVADVRVTYTHSLLSAMFLKTGAVGVFLSLAYLGMILRLFLLSWKVDWPLFTALGGPFLISTLFYASYKSLDYGFLLLLMIVGKRVHSIASQTQDI